MFKLEKKWNVPIAMEYKNGEQLKILPLLLCILEARSKDENQQLW